MLFKVSFGEGIREEGNRCSFKGGECGFVRSKGRFSVVGVWVYDL